MGTTTSCDTWATLGAFIWGIHWLNVLLALGVLYALFLLWKMHRGENSFSALDFVTAENGKGDVTKLHVNVFAALSVWLIVVLVQKDKIAEVVTLTPIILGIFVLKQAIGNIANAFGSNQPGAGK